MLPSRSTWMPWANAIIPAPKLLMSLPVESNFSTGSSGDIAPVAGLAQLFAPQRSPTQIDLPSLSMSTALVDPQVRPSGSLKTLTPAWYGLGKSLVGAEVACAKARHPDIATAATTSARASFMASPLAALTAALLLHVLLHGLRSDLGTVDVAGGIDRHAFGRARARKIVSRARTRLGIGDEAFNLAGLDVAKTNPALPAV